MTRRARPVAPPVERVHLSELRSDRAKVVAAARQPGGVTVVNGRRRFVLWIPSRPLGDD